MIGFVAKYYDWADGVGESIIDWTEAYKGNSPTKVCRGDVAVACSISSSVNEVEATCASPLKCQPFRDADINPVSSTSMRCCYSRFLTAPQGISAGFLRYGARCRCGIPSFRVRWYNSDEAVSR